MRLTFRCKRKKAKYGETFMRALKDLQQPIMLNAHKNVFSWYCGIWKFSSSTHCHIWWPTKKILEALKPHWLAMTATLREVQTIIIYCIQKFPLKWCMRDIPKLWSQSLTSDRIWLHLLAQWSVSASADIFFDTWSFCNGSAPQLNFGALITDYEMIKKQICLQYIPQLMSHLNMMVCLCLILT